MNMYQYSPAAPVYTPEKRQTVTRNILKWSCGNPADWFWIYPVCLDRQAAGGVDGILWLCFASDL